MAEVAEIEGSEPLPTPDEPPPRGRQATHVFQMPWRGWRDVLGRVRRELRRDNLDIVAAGMTFYSVLAIGPALVALVSIYGLFAEPQDVEALVEPVVEQFMSGSGRALIEELLKRAVSQAPESLTLRALGAIALSVWSANRGMKSLIAAVGLAYEEDERRGVIRENLLSLSFVGVALLALGLTAVLLIALPHLIAGAGSLVGEGIAWLLNALRWPVLFAVVLLGLASLYRWAPARRPPQWRWVTPGAIVATLCWLLFSAAFAIYSRHTGDVRTGHEALDNVIGLLIWFYVSAWAILLGAELNAELEHQTACDSTIGPPLPLGHRGAFVADHIGDASTS